MYDEYRRPSVVTAAAVMLYIAAGVNLLFGGLGLAAGGADSRVVLASLLLIGIGLAWLVLTNKVRNGSWGARTTVIVLLSISCVLSLDDVVSVGLNLLIIGLLAWNRDAQDYFRSNRVDRRVYRGERNDHKWWVNDANERVDHSW